MSRKHCDFVDFSELEEVLDELGISKKDAYIYCASSKAQFYNWRKKGRVPVKNYSTFQKALNMFLEKQKLKKMVRIGLIDKEFLMELLEENNE